METSGWLRSCHFCGSSWGDCEWACGSCLQRLKALTGPRRYEPPIYDFDLHTLFVWNKGEDHTWKSELLLHLKGGGLPKTLRLLATWLARRSSQQGFEDVIWVPAPARIQGQRDHAYALAEALCDLLGGTLANPLVRLSEDEQKKKSAVERAQSKMRGGEEAPSLSSKIVFVDDLVASGSTVIAAYQALKEPPHFSAWALAHRPKLAENKGR